MTLTQHLQVSGIFPHLAQTADLGPPRSECGIGCMMPWNGKLYVVNYVSHRRKSGTGTGLRVIDEDLTMHRHPAGEDGTYANRFVHFPSNQMIVGPHVVDAQHNVRTVHELTDIRIAGTCQHLHKPEDYVYVLGMEGELFELNVRSLAVSQVLDLNAILGGEGEMKVHFKDCYCALGKLVICSNEYHELDWRGERAAGRLAEWDGVGEWKILERKPFVCVHGRHSFGQTIFATGWDRASAMLKVYTKSDDTWRTYRLPKASHCFDHKWQTEWPRIREVEHERFLMDHHGMFYELSPWAYGGHVWGVRPISTHLWVMGDFCSWRGMLVLGADNASPSDGDSPTTAEAQSGLWMGKTDDLWSFGKPMGWGGPWWETMTAAGVPSDPYLMTGFEHKCLHLSHKSSSTVRFTVEVDYTGAGTWGVCNVVETPPNGYQSLTFPEGFSAHWVRVTADVTCNATAQLFYT